MDQGESRQGPAETNDRGARCAKHGLLYNPADPRGCVLCRREAGETIAPPADSGNALRNAWLTTAGLILATAAGLYLAHDQAIQTVLRWTPPTSKDPAPVDDGFELDDEADPADPYAEKIRDALETLKKVEGESEERARATDGAFDE
jgi:hypothetical protein